MPFYVEITQTTTMAGPVGQPPRIHVGPHLFSYKADTKTLLLDPSIVAGSAGSELLIGEITVLETPTQTYENRAIAPFPSAQPALLQVLEFDAITGVVRFVVAGEVRSLAPGERLTPKQPAGSSAAPGMVTVIVNHGRLAGIQAAAPDGSLR